MQFIYLNDWEFDYVNPFIHLSPQIVCEYISLLQKSSYSDDSKYLTLITFWLKALKKVCISSTNVNAFEKIGYITRDD